MPHAVKSSAAPALLTAQYAEFREAVERWTGREIADGDLARTSALAEGVRARLREILDLRRDDDPHLTGAEALAVSAACTVADKAETLPLLDDLVRQLGRRRAPVQTADPVRLLFIGSESDDLALVETVEELGGIVVAEDHCAGSRWYGGAPLPEGEPLAALAARALGRPPCPTKDFPERSRTERAADLALRWRARGALLVQQKFCDPHEADLPVLGRRLEEMGVPVLALECDVTLPRGQLRTRVEAFLETLRSDDLFGAGGAAP
jgi:benzoyl-CoA reductase subunit C